MDALFCDVHLIFADGLARRDYLTVDICKTYFVIIDQIQSTDAAPGQSLYGISSDTSDAEHCNTGIFKLIHALMPKKQTCSGKLIKHYFLLHHKVLSTPVTIINSGSAKSRKGVPRSSGT